jgi:hypothetical protein
MARHFGLIERGRREGEHAHAAREAGARTRGDVQPGSTQAMENMKHDQSAWAAEVFLRMLVIVGAAAAAAAALIAAGLSFLWSIGVVNARDLGQWGDVDPQISAWFAGLMQPDSFPPVSCCGEADAYWADQVEIRTDGEGHQQIVAVITDDRDDGPLRRIHEDIGKRYVVPPNKITRQDGNPTGHVVIFLGGVTLDRDGNRAEPRAVLCYVQNGGV